MGKGLVAMITHIRNKRADEVWLEGMRLFTSDIEADRLLDAWASRFADEETLQDIEAIMATAEGGK